MNARIVLALRTLGDRLTSISMRPHLTTDPACKQHRAPYPGSRLDRVSRGRSCGPCMRDQHLAWVERAIRPEWNQR